MILGKSQKEKPSIIVSGADDGRVYLLRPQSWSQYIWHYSTDVILHREGSSIGVPAVGDVDGDGNVEVFVPEKNFIHVLTYAGKSISEKNWLWFYFLFQVQKNREETDGRVETVEIMDIQREWALLLLFFSHWPECFYKHQSESNFFNQTDLQYNQSEQSSNQ